LSQSDLWMQTHICQWELQVLFFAWD